MRRAALLGLLLLAGCGNTLQRLSEVGEPPRMTPSSDPTKAPGWRPVSLPMPTAMAQQYAANSLWRPGARAFLKDERATAVGDVLTVLVNIADTALFNDNTTAQRNGNEAMAIPVVPGMKVSGTPPSVTSVSSSNANLATVSTNANIATGQIARNETVVVRVAGVVTQVLPNGNLVVVARQQVRVNSELRELTVSGIVRPQDIASDNTVQHDRMAEARISYGGRGQLTDLQTARYGQQLLDILLPF
jgi:flagellar L-ring protein precursor FlgH